MLNLFYITNLAVVLIIWRERTVCTFPPDFCSNLFLCRIKLNIQKSKEVLKREKGRVASIFRRKYRYVGKKAVGRIF